MTDEKAFRSRRDRSLFPNTPRTSSRNTNATPARWHPSGMRDLTRSATGGVVAALLDHRLMAVKPPAWTERLITKVWTVRAIPRGCQPLAGVKRGTSATPGAQTSTKSDPGGIAVRLGKRDAQPPAHRREPSGFAFNQDISGHNQFRPCSTSRSIPHETTSRDDVPPDWRCNAAHRPARWR